MKPAIPMTTAMIASGERPEGEGGRMIEMSEGAVEFSIVWTMISKLGMKLNIFSIVVIPLSAKLNEQCFVDVGPFNFH